MAIITPVLVMLVLGYFCRRYKIVSRKGMEGIKSLACNIMLPVVFVDALGRMEYTARIAIVLLVMMASLFAAYGIGRLLSGTVKGYGHLVPCLTTAFEGGMMAYPLYINLRGSVQLSNMVMIDLATCLFAPTIYIMLLSSASPEGESRSGGAKMKSLVKGMLRVPPFYGMAFGLLLGLTGLLRMAIASPAGIVYEALISMITGPLGALILLSVGYDFHLDRIVQLAAAKTALLRVCVQAVLLAVEWLVLRSVLEGPDQMAALVLYAFMPPVFMSPLYVKTEKDRQYVATTVSMYVLISVAAFVVVTIVFP